MQESQRVNASRSLIDEKEFKEKYQKECSEGISSLGISYTHIRSLRDIVGPRTKKIIAYHSFLESLDGFEDTDGIEIAYLGFNRLSAFREKDAKIKEIGILDLAGNPITSLRNCPPCKQLIVSSTKTVNLVGCPEGVEIVRCGHSDHLLSLHGCPKSVKIVECSCAPNLKICAEDLPLDLEELIQ